MAYSAMELDAYGEVYHDCSLIVRVQNPKANLVEHEFRTHAVVSLVFRGLQRNGELEVGGVNVGTLAEMADDLYTITQSF